MLWGGLLMLAALVTVLAFLGTWPRRIAAVLGGLGFGTFIDELGKFVTSDNDYFFKPTVGLLYVLFVLLFLLFRAIERRKELTPQENLLNAVNSLRDVVRGKASRPDVERTLTFLDRSGADGPVADGLRTIIAGLDVRPGSPELLPRRLAGAGHRLYDRLLAWRWFQRAVVLVFLFRALAALALTLGALLVAVIGGALMLGAGQELQQELRQELQQELGQGQQIDLGATLSQQLRQELGQELEREPLAFAAVAAAGVTAVLAAVGAVRLPRSRQVGLRWFKGSVLVSLLVVQPISFLTDEFGALTGLAFDLVLWLAVNYMLRAEAVRHAAGSGRMSHSGEVLAAPAFSRS